MGETIEEHNRDVNALVTCSDDALDQPLRVRWIERRKGEYWLLIRSLSSNHLRLPRYIEVEVFPTIGSTGR